MTFLEALFQHRDVGIQCRDVAEGSIFNVVTLESNVTTLQNSMFSMSRRAREVYFQRRDVDSNVATFPRLATRKFYKTNF